MKKLLFFLLFASFSSVFAQNDEVEIKSTIDKFFDGFKKQDSLIVKEMIHQTCFLKSVEYTKTGELKLSETPMSVLIKSVGTKRPNVMLDERLTSYHFKVDGPMAMAWTPYEFYVNEKFSHCGVDLFTLMKTDKGWKIIGIVDTRRKENCVK